MGMNIYYVPIYYVLQVPYQLAFRFLSLISRQPCLSTRSIPGGMTILESDSETEIQLARDK